jgi:hypothetical protein
VYDDQDANNNFYGNTAGGGKLVPGCESSEHRGLKFDFSLQVWQMQAAFAIN